MLSKYCIYIVLTSIISIACHDKARKTPDIQLSKEEKTIDKISDTTNLLGTWFSTADRNSQLEINDNTVTFLYSGISSGAHPYTLVPNCAAKKDKSSTSVRDYIFIHDLKNCYRIQSVTADTLRLYFENRNKELLYVKWGLN